MLSRYRLSQLILHSIHSRSLLTLNDDTEKQIHHTLPDQKNMYDCTYCLNANASNMNFFQAEAFDTDVIVACFGFCTLL